MKRNIIKPVLAGLLLGTALFFMPFFVLRVATVVLVVFILFRIFSGRRPRRGFGHRRSFPQFADKIRNMSDEEYSRFKENFRWRCGYGRQPQQEGGNASAS